MTPSQMRAMRAKQLLDSGRDAHEVAKELGYTKVSAMLGAISLCSRKIERDEAKLGDLFGKTLHVTNKEATPDGLRANIVIVDEMSTIKPMPMVIAKANTKIYPVENGIVTIDKALCSVTYKPDVGTAFINLKTYRKWLPLFSTLLGGSEALAATLRQIAEAATEAAALIEEVSADVDHHA